MFWNNDEEREIYLLKSKIACKNSHMKAVETVFTHRFELQPHKRKEIIQYISNTKSITEKEIKQLESKLKQLQDNCEI